MRHYDGRYATILTADVPLFLAGERLRLGVHAFHSDSKRRATKWGELAMALAPQGAIPEPPRDPGCSRKPRLGARVVTTCHPPPCHPPPFAQRPGIQPSRKLAKLPPCAGPVLGGMRPPLSRSAAVQAIPPPVRQRRLSTEAEFWAWLGPSGGMAHATLHRAKVDDDIMQRMRDVIMQDEIISATIKGTRFASSTAAEAVLFAVRARCLS